MKSNTVDLTFDWDDDTFKADLTVKKSGLGPVVTFSQDPLALSWVSYYIWQRKPGQRWTDLKDLEAHEHDIIIANETRKYYRNKLTISALKGKPMTPVQSVMYSIVTDEPIRNDQMGVLYRLPYFYVEDITHEHVVAETKLYRPATPMEKTYVERKGTITPLREVLVSRKGKEIQEYWFKDENDYAVLWQIQYNNPLKHTIGKLWEANKPIQISAFWHAGAIQSLDKHPILQLSNVELLF